MEPKRLLLLWLGLCLSPGIQAFYFWSPAPEIRMKPGNIRPLGSSITISCYTPLRADYFRLETVDTEGDVQVGEKVPAIYPGHECHLYQPSLRFEHGAGYRCLYNFEGQWSKRSFFKDLIISGVYSKPFMNITSTNVKEGSSVVFHCKPTKDQFEVWVLIKGEPDTENFVVEQREKDLEHQIEDMNPSHSGVYTCYGHNEENLYLWSHPSDPVSIDIIQKNLAPRYSPGIPLTSVVLALIALQSQPA
ncbi:platelet glycoprotein VI-like [Vombatus ursinus]|uniref:Ig-like domain-containing protein n=1 Tax=Vombatus ursinus TaxID=29139 RepID=A0A4X2JYK5_VOMUR|nr:platelet glycoprotein VI-like [Vombatus ursinus]